jgi:hypothetical protein
MPLFRCLIPALLLLLTGPTCAEQALQLSAELTSPPVASVATTPQTITLLPDPSREVRDDLPPIPTIDLTTRPTTCGSACATASPCPTSTARWWPTARPGT